MRAGCHEVAIVRATLPAIAFLILGLLATGPAASSNPCDDQPVHTYVLGGYLSGSSALIGQAVRGGNAMVTDSGTADCNPADGVPLDFDGDYDVGVGGAFFGYGRWAEDPDCNYELNVHGPHVEVHDLVHRGDVWFVVGESDQDGPTRTHDPQTGKALCEPDGTINPCWNNDPAMCDPSDDMDDCLSPPFRGVGTTCGTGGADGGYWVFLTGVSVEGTMIRNVPTSGTITASHAR